MNKSPKQNQEAKIDDPGSARVFFALWPNDEESKAFERWQYKLSDLCGGRAMRIKTLHLTLVFIGEVELQQIETLIIAAKEIRGNAFELSFSEARYWNHNHIVYAVPSIIPPQIGQLVLDLQQCIDIQQAQMRSFMPHVTLLRNAKWNGDFLCEMEKNVWQVKNFVLVTSVPDGAGASYHVLESFKLS